MLHSESPPDIFLFHRSNGDFSFDVSKEKWGFESPYLLELMFVLMALTFSAKALSVFIFFSTCWME